jgi:hypothetical protein
MSLSLSISFLSSMLPPSEERTMPVKLAHVYHQNLVVAPMLPDRNKAQLGGKKRTLRHHNKESLWIKRGKSLKH